MVFKRGEVKFLRRAEIIDCLWSMVLVRKVFNKPSPQPVFISQTFPIFRAVSEPTIYLAPSVPLMPHMKNSLCWIVLRCTYQVHVLIVHICACSLNTREAHILRTRSKKWRVVMLHRFIKMKRLTFKRFTEFRKIRVRNISSVGRKLCLRLILKCGVIISNIISVSARNNMSHFNLAIPRLHCH